DVCSSDLRQAALGQFGVVGPVDHEPAVAGQAAGQPRGQFGFVFDQQDAHAAIIESAPRLCTARGRQGPARLPGARGMPDCPIVSQWREMYANAKLQWKGLEHRRSGLKRTLSVVILLLLGIAAVLGTERYDRSRSEARIVAGVRQQLNESAGRFQDDLRVLQGLNERLAGALAAVPG